MANRGLITLDASLMPDHIRIFFKNQTFSYLPADSTEKWIYQLTNVTNSNQVLISGNFFGNAVDAGGSGSAARATGDKVKFLFSGTHCVEIPSGMSWFARCPNTTVAHIQAISGAVNGTGTSSVKIQCAVAAILDDV
jgi:hypothetical protein